MQFYVTEIAEPEPDPARKISEFLSPNPARPEKPGPIDNSVMNDEKAGCFGGV